MMNGYVSRAGGSRAVVQHEVLDTRMSWTLPLRLGFHPGPGDLAMPSHSVASNRKTHMTRVTNLWSVTAFLLVLWGASQALATAEEEPRLEPARRVVARGGLPNAARKLANGEDVSVVFIGGSITVGGGAPHGYVTRVGGWLRKTYPKAKITATNAGIGGTDSNFGAKRYDRDVLTHKPDLVFIEFCVNDGDRDHTQHMERMVHKTWMANPDTDIVIFYTLAKTHLPSYEKGMLPPSASAHERVARFYGIPSIGTGYLAARKILDGGIEWKDFSNDGCHPHAGGYAIFEQAFNEALPELLATGEPGKHALGRSITGDLQVYPPKLEAAPQTIEPLVTAKGEEARGTYQLPIPAINWVGEPSFQGVDGKTIWRLHYQERATGASPEIGLDKEKWSGNSMVWFEEGRCFTGPDGNALFSGCRKDTTRISFSGRETAVVTFVAPATGRYVLQVAIDGVGVWRNEDKEYGVNLGVFRSGANEGRSLKFAKALKSELRDIHWEVEVDLRAGEEVAVIPVTTVAGWMRGGINNVVVRVGLM